MDSSVDSKMDKANFTWDTEVDGKVLHLNQFSLHFFGSVSYVFNLKGSMEEVGVDRHGAFPFYLSQPSGVFGSHSNMCLAYAIKLVTGDDKNEDPPVLKIESKSQTSTDGITVTYHKLIGNPDHPAYNNLELQNGLTLTREALSDAQATERVWSF